MAPDRISMTQRRESLILEVTRDLFVQRGYLGTNMDLIARAARCSKPTVYRHFACKEEIVLALALEGVRKRVELFRRALMLPGLARERIIGLAVADMLFGVLFPRHCKMERIIGAASIREKTSLARRQEYDGLLFRCLELAAAPVREALAGGDLVLSGDRTIGWVTHGFSALAYGVRMPVSGQALDEAAMGGIMARLQDYYHAFMDGLGWQPLSGQWDYAATIRRIRVDLFADEFHRLQAHGADAGVVADWLLVSGMEG